MKDLVKECFLEIANEQLERSNPYNIPAHHEDRRLQFVLDCMPRQLIFQRLADKLAEKGVQLPATK